MREVRLEAAHNVLQVERVMHGDPEDIPFFVRVDFPPHRPFERDAERKKAHDRLDARLLRRRDVHVKPGGERVVAAVPRPVTVHKPEGDSLP